MPALPDLEKPAATPSEPVADLAAAIPPEQKTEGDSSGLWDIAEFVVDCVSGICDLA